MIPTSDRLLDAGGTTPSVVVITGVLLFRMAYSGAVTVAVTYLMGTSVFGWSIPSIPIEFGEVHWVGLFVVTAFIIIGGGFRLWVALSWATAYAVFPSVRLNVHDADERSPQEV